MSFRIDSKGWAEEQFSGCDLGDKRRTKRLVRMAEQVAQNPSGSFPEQMQSWGDLKAAYRLFDCDDVSFDAVAEPHWKQTRSVPAGRYLILGDTTEIDFGYRRDIEGLRPIGNGSRRGFLLHNALMVDADSKALLGLAGQTIHYRRAAPKKETRSQRSKRDRESLVWGKVIDQIGPPADGVELVHVFDRGADDFGVFCHLLQNGADWVVRATSMGRCIKTADGESCTLKEHLSTLPLAGTYELDIRTRPKQPARTAKLEVCIGELQMPIPRHKTPYIKALNPEPIRMSVVWVREVEAARGVKPIEWVLFTSLPVGTFDDAWVVVEYYECRWLIEEYHKALKTGCSVQNRLLRHSDRLEGMVGLMSVVAVRLLQLKSVAYSEPERPAKSVVPMLWLQMLKGARKKLQRVHDLTVYQFYREIAKLGGFLGRKSDGEPGWITLWRGWEKLNTMVQAAEIASHIKRCG